MKVNLGLDDDENDSSATNFAELVSKLVDIVTPTKSREKNCIIALSNAEILRQLDSFLLPGKACLLFLSSKHYNIHLLVLETKT